MNTKIMRRMLLAVAGLCGLLSWGAPADTAPGKSAPGGANNLDYLYVFGPSGRASSGAEDYVQVNFYRFPAGAGQVTLWVYSPGYGGRHDKRALFGSGQTSYTVYGGAGAYSAAASQSARPSTDQPGTVLASESYGKETGDEWIQFGPFDASQGESVGGHVYFKLVAAGVSGSTANVFSTAYLPAAGEAFTYNMSMNMTAEAGESMFFDVEVPAGTTEIHEHNYDMDNGGQPYFHNGGERTKLNSSRTANWTTNRIAVNGSGRMPYEVVKGIQGYANAAWYVHDADGNENAVPRIAEDFAGLTPIYEELPGWSESTLGLRSLAQLPANARAYIERIEALVSAPIDIISTGPDRVETIVLRQPFE